MVSGAFRTAFSGFTAVSGIVARSASAVLALAVLASVGCGNGLTPVEGKVTLDGVPVAKGTISFIPADGKGTTCFAEVQPTGTYRVHLGHDEGMLPGQYEVTITATEIPEATKANPNPTPRYLVPQRYSNPATSKLSITVPSGNYDLPLTK